VLRPTAPDFKPPQQPGPAELLRDEAESLMRAIWNRGAIHSTTDTGVLHALVNSLARVAALSAEHATQPPSALAPQQAPPPSLPLLQPAAPAPQALPASSTAPQQMPPGPVQRLRAPMAVPPPTPRSPQATRPPRLSPAQEGKSPLPSAVVAPQPQPPAPLARTQRPSLHGSPAARARPLRAAPRRDTPQHDSTQGGKTRCSLPQERRAARNRAAHARRARRRTRAIACGLPAAAEDLPRQQKDAEQHGEMFDILLPLCDTQHERRRHAPHVPRACASRRLSFG